MKIVRIQCGLGNQMFQYAFYLALRERSGAEEVKVDVTFRPDTGKTLELTRAFAVQPDLVSDACLDRLYDRQHTLAARVRRKLLGRRTRLRVFEERQKDRLAWSYAFKPEVFELAGNVYFEGYWQSERFFLAIRDQVLASFTFRNVRDDKTATFLRELDGQKTVSLHVRRGDYLAHPSLKWIAESSYYTEAIAHVRDQLGACRFVVFSDDVPWCRERLSLAPNEALFVDWNTGRDSYKDMYLMSRCQHNIVANSSFSWWGAWLNTNPGKLVVAPRRWVDFGAYGHPELRDTDIVPESWVRI